MRRLPRRAPQKGARVVCALPVACEAKETYCLLHLRCSHLRRMGDRLFGAACVLQYTVY